ncbi:MAG: chromo domain-containing protein [Acidimicrobiales bacterium]
MNRLHPVFHVSLLQKYGPPAGGRRKRSPDPIVLDSGELEWEVEAILYHRERKYKKRGKTAYDFFIKWKGYGMEEASWEPAEHLSNCGELLQEYWATHGEGAPLPEQVPELDERSRGYTIARENIATDSDAVEALSKRGRKRKRHETSALRRSKRLHPE